MNMEQIEKESWEYANKLYPNPDRHNAPYTTEYDLQDAAYQHYKQGLIDGGSKIINLLRLAYDEGRDYILHNNNLELSSPEPLMFNAFLAKHGIVQPTE